MLKELVPVIDEEDEWWDQLEDVGEELEDGVVLCVVLWVYVGLHDDIGNAKEIGEYVYEYEFAFELFDCFLVVTLCEKYYALLEHLVPCQDKN